MTLSSHDRRLVRLEEKGWAKDNSLMRVVAGAERLHNRRRRAALALVAFAQELAGVDPSAAVPEPARNEASAHVEALPVRRRESPPPIIPGSTNDPNSSAYMRPWVEGAVEVPEVPDGPDMPKGPWAHWGFEPPPSYAREAEDGTDCESA